MRIIIYFLYSLILFSCNLQKEEGSRNNNQNDIIKKNQDVSIDIKTQDSYEFWVNMTYIDSTVLNKKIYLYSHNFSSFAYMISFDRKRMDSLTLIGYHERYKDIITKLSDSLYRFSNYEEQYGLISFEKEYISYRMVSKNDTSSKCQFRLLDGKIKSLQYYFASNIFSGKYLNTKSNQTIEFKDDLSVTGIDSVENYKILIDFWEMVPQMDVVYFYDNNNILIGQYNWNFNQNYLYLQQVQNSYENDTGWVEGGVFGEIIKLEKLK